MKKSIILVVVIIILTFTAACSVRETPAAPPTATLPLLPTATKVIATATPQPTAALPTLQPTLTASPTPRPVLPIPATVTFDNFILREGPGRLFDRVDMYDSGSQVTVLGRVMGDNWVLVQTADHCAGWMNTSGLDHLGNFDSLPLYHAQGAIMLSGHVWSANRSPVSGITVAVFPAGSSDNNLREDVTTGADGTWYAYLPGNSKGDWEVQVVSCPAAMDLETCRETLPAGQVVTLPNASEVSIEMSFRP